MRVQLVVCLGLLASGAALAAGPEGNSIFMDDGRIIRYFPLHDAHADLTAIDVTNLSPDVADALDAASNQAGLGSLRYHGGPVILTAKEKSLFWGPGTGFDTDYAPHVANFFAQFGQSAEYTTITQYTNGSGQAIKNSALGGSNYFDSTQPASTVTDADCQNELKKNFQNGVLGTPDSSTVYFLYLPKGVTSTSGGSSSCVNYCGYHSNFTYNNVPIKYAVMPYPSCGGCQGSQQAGYTIATSSVTIVSGHEMREAATDPLGNAWYDFIGYEADDKCAWILFIDGSYQHQKEWSNKTNSCVMKGILGP